MLESVTFTAYDLKGGGCHAPAPLCQNRVCLTRGVSPGACHQGRVPRGVQGRAGA